MKRRSFLSLIGLALVSPLIASTKKRVEMVEFPPSELKRKPHFKQEYMLPRDEYRVTATEIREIEAEMAEELGAKLSKMIDEKIIKEMQDVAHKSIV